MEASGMSVPSAIKTINAGSSCFLVQAESGFVLIDTGAAYKRMAVERELMTPAAEPEISRS